MCQALVDDETRCDVNVDWSVEKVAQPDYLLDPDHDEVRYEITVTEGEASYALDIATVLELTGLEAEGSQIRGVTVSLQRGDGEGAFATVASARIGDVLDEDCGCSFVAGGDLDLELRDDQGQIIDLGGEAIVEHLGYGERANLFLQGSYDLAAGVIVPGDPVRVQTCVRWARVGDLDRPGCVYDGGGIRTARTCNPFDFTEWATADPGEVAVTDTLEHFDRDFVTLGKFTAYSDSPQVSPTSPLTLLNGGSAVFAVSATGTAGTTSTIEVEGEATCAAEVACDTPAGGRCEAPLVNGVTLDTGAEDAASATLACTLQRCPVEGCDDGDPCTEDVCDPSVGCLNTPTTGPSCDDGDACTTGDACVAGACSGDPVDCGDDGDACTVSWCDPVEGACLTGPAPDGTTCDDGDACTTGDQCAAGVCEGGSGRACDDDNPCTVDRCDPSVGCVHSPREGPCDDGDACTDGDVCVAAECVPGPPLECGASGPCRGSYCDPRVGCVEPPVDDGAWCDDGDACTGCPWPESGVKRGFMVRHADVIDEVMLPGGYVLWMVGFYGGHAQVRMRGLDDLRLLWFEDDTAVLRGTVEVHSTGGGPPATDDRYSLELEMTYRGRGAAGQGSGGPHRELPDGWQGFEWSDGWRYFEVEGGRLDSHTSSAWAELTVRPAPGVFPAQVGWHANGRNGNFGASGWFFFEHHREDAPPIEGIGDFNVDLTEVYCGDNDLCHDGVCASGDDVLACEEIDPGDYCTWRPEDFAAQCLLDGDPACLLEDHFRAVVDAAPQCAGDATVTIGFTTWKRFAFSHLGKLKDFLAPGSTWGPSVGRKLLCNPHAIYASDLARELLTLKINVKLSDRGVSPAPNGHPLGALEIARGQCAGMTVRELLQLGEMHFAGLELPSGPCTQPQVLLKAIRSVNRAFLNCGTADGLLIPGPPWSPDGVTKAHQVIVAPMPTP